MKYIIFCLYVLYIILPYIQADPSFGNEYVHIKVHVPKEDSSNIEHTTAANKLYPPAHKVIHHYHHRRRRKPIRKVPSTTPKSKESALIESLILSDLGSNHAEHVKYLKHANDIAQQFTEAPKPKKKVETYRIVEEIKKIPEPMVETYKVIEKPVASSKGYHYEPANNYEAEEQHDYQHSPGIAETIAITASKTAKSSYDYSPHKKELIEYEERPLRTNSVKIVHEQQEPLHGYHYKPKYAVEITESTESLKHNSNIESGYRYQQEKPNGYHYEPPSEKYATSSLPRKPAEFYGPPPKSHKPPSEYYSTSLSETYLPPSSYEQSSSSKPYEIPSDTYQIPPHKYTQVPFRSSSYAVTMPDSYASQLSITTERLRPAYTHSDETYSTTADKDDSYLHHIQNYNHNHRDESNLRQNSLLDIENKSASYRDRDRDGYSYRPPASTTSIQSTSSVYNANIDWPKESFYAQETYKGSDSYSVPHVQGLGSGGYKYSV